MISDIDCLDGTYDVCYNYGVPFCNVYGCSRHIVACQSSNGLAITKCDHGEVVA